MNAVVHSPRFKPKPIRHGFYVDSTWFTLLKHCNYAAHRTSYPIVPAIDMSRYFKPFKPVPRTAAPSPKPEMKATTGLFSDRSCGADNNRMQAHDDEDVDTDETLDISMSTVDTLGPETLLVPPHNRALKSKSRYSLLTPNIGGQLSVLTSTVNNFPDRPVSSSRDLFGTSSVVFVGQRG
jgi:hypothetical protein